MVQVQPVILQKKLNREFIGIEKEKEFFDISKRRIESI